MQINNDKKKSLFIKSYGCQMNEYDSERMAEILEPLNYFPVSEPGKADLIILNTCHIREKAAEKIYSELGRIKKINLSSKRDTKIAVAGCVGQAQGQEIINRAPMVDLVFGPLTYHQLPEMLESIKTEKGLPKKRLVNIDVPDVDKFDELKGPRKSLKSISSLLSIQEGCDKFCSFCVVPYTRGVEISRPENQIMKEAIELIESGAKELILLGQNVNAWSGKGLDESSWTFPRLIRELSQLSIERIRYITSHPRDMTDELMRSHKDIEKLQPYLHLPVQSGSDRVLKEMNRGYTFADYMKIIDKTREYRPDIAVSGDFIVGFPGETDKDFQDTLRIVEEVKYAHAYSFKYSSRPGTPASMMENHIEEDVKSERLKILQDLIKQQTRDFNKSFEGKEINVLIDKPGNGEDRLSGRSAYLQTVHMDGKASMIGQIIKAKVSKSRDNSLECVIS
ncbi:tRNA (N6-isopentenyl adenosine(37)-C2)-methylthiotransferase MiaB [Hyphomicrobiales bacterium]|nr:tRNA (N6-isopentenyl adenosine(37)-C2)-methylthiotransferase MiaB [Hyphomicrobiales bacterium]